MKLKGFMNGLFVFLIALAILRNEGFMAFLGAIVGGIVAIIYDKQINNFFKKLILGFKKITSSFVDWGD